MKQILLLPNSAICLPQSKQKADPGCGDSVHDLG